MALDITILAENGEPEATVPIRVDSHGRLMGIVDDAKLPLLSRLRDYYEDTEYEPQELDLLVAELDYVVEHVQAGDELVKLIAEMTNLVISAKRLGRHVVVIAD